MFHSAYHNPSSPPPKVAQVVMTADEALRFKMGDTYDVKLGPGEGMLKGVCRAMELLADGKVTVYFHPYDHYPVGSLPAK